MQRNYFCQRGGVSHSQTHKCICDDSSELPEYNEETKSWSGLSGLPDNVTVNHAATHCFKKNICHTFQYISVASLKTSNTDKCKPEEDIHPAMQKKKEKWYPYPDLSDDNNNKEPW